MSNLGRAIRKLRIEKGLTQGQLGLYAGLDRGHLSKIEHGKVDSVGSEILGRIARTLGVSADYLLQQSGLPPSRTARAELAEGGLDLDQLAVMAEHDDSILRILVALPHIPPHDRVMLALFVEGMRDWYDEQSGRSTSPASRPPTDEPPQDE